MSFSWSSFNWPCAICNIIHKHYKHFLHYHYDARVSLYLYDNSNKKRLISSPLTKFWSNSFMIQNRFHYRNVLPDVVSVWLTVDCDRSSYDKVRKHCKDNSHSHRVSIMALLWLHNWHIRVLRQLKTKKKRNHRTFENKNQLTLIRFLFQIVLRNLRRWIGRWFHCWPK